MNMKMRQNNGTGCTACKRGVQGEGLGAEGRFPYPHNSSRLRYNCSHFVLCYAVSTMPESSAESTAFFRFWDIVRYLLVALMTGVLIWWSFFYTPPLYASKEHSGKTMGTDYIVKVARFPETGDWKKLANDIQSRLDTLDQKMSTYKSDSEVCRFNAFTSTEEWFSVSGETAYVVQVALEISQLSGGAFDITVAPLVRHWGFGAGSRPGQTKSFEELTSEAALLKEQTGYEKLSVRLDPPALKKAIPELSIDLSAIAKGFAVDCLAELLEAQKITDYLVEVGGEVRSKGKKGKDKEGKDMEWIVGVENPLQSSAIQQKLVLGNKSLATSGSYLQRLQVEGRSISHIIDPRTGMPVGESELVSVAVMASDCIRADAWATAMFVLGEQRGGTLASQHGIAVLFLLKNGNEIVEVPSKNWSQK